MGSLLELCRNETALTQRQIERLRVCNAVLELAADLAHAYVSVYVRTQGGALAVVAQAKPHTSFSRYEPNALGSRVRQAEEPLIWRTLETAQPIRGKREWGLGALLDMYAFPLCDADGACIAAVSFEANPLKIRLERYAYVLETACMLLSGAQTPADPEQYKALSASDGIVIADSQHKIRFVNTAALRIYKVLGVGEAVGLQLFDRRMTMHIVKETTVSRHPYEKEIEAGNLVLLQRSIPILVDGQQRRTVLVISDVTDLRKKEKELLIKSAVIQEIHHRVKNNLQTIASLLRLQARRTQSEEVRAALRESVNRILSISVVHEFLSQQDAEAIDVVEVARNILAAVTQTMLEPGFSLQTRFEGGTVILPSEKASSLALVLNELVQNAVEHAFVGRAEGCIGLRIATRPDAYEIDLYDDGAGYGADFNPQQSRRLGLQIVRTLVEDDLGGSLRLYSDGGAHAAIVMPRAAEGGKKP